MEYEIESEHFSEYNFSLAMKDIAKRYEAENRLLDAIAIGNQTMALQALEDFNSYLRTSSQKIVPRTDDSLRNSKNLLVVMNTLFRKTVERSQVHPIYIDRFSSRFAKKIETLASLEECKEFPYEMVKKYCSLVKNYSLATYSLLIRNTLVHIHVNLYTPITLKDVAEKMKVNASYLSSQFKKEVGETLTDYIRTQRINTAVNLLNTTDLSIQEIAFQVGIDDISYFSKQFKKQVGRSPMQYRKMLKQ